MPDTKPPERSNQGFPPRVFMREGLDRGLKSELSGEFFNEVVRMLVLKLSIAVFLAAMGLGLTLQFLGGFRVTTSPGWHLVLVYVDLLLFGLGPFLTAVQLGPSRLRVWQVLAFGTVVASLAGVVVLGWWVSGAPAGFRDERIVPLTAMFVVVSSVGVCSIIAIRVIVTIATRWDRSGRPDAGSISP